MTGAKPALRNSAVSHPLSIIGEIRLETPNYGISQCSRRFAISIRQDKIAARLRTARYDVLDGWRGVAALMVAIFHFDALHHGYSLPLVRNSYLFVDFFFVLSGFVIAHAYAGRLNSVEDAAVFAVRRFGRVWPLHVAVLAIFVGLECAKWALTTFGGFKSNLPAFAAGGATPFGDLPAHVTLTHALGFLPRLTWNHPSWSISAEFWSYLIFAGVTLACRGRWRVIALAFLAAIPATILVVFARDGMNATFDLGLPRCLFGFAAGVLTYEVTPILRIRRALAARAEWLVAGVIIAFVSAAGTSPLSFAAPLVFAAAVFIFSFEAGPLSRALQARPFQALGRWSYSIYMVHIPLILVLHMPARNLFVTLPDGSRVAGGLSPFVYDGGLVVYILAVLAVARLTHRTIEEPGRLAFNALAGRLGTRLAAQQPAHRAVAN